MKMRMKMTMKRKSQWEDTRHAWRRPDATMRSRLPRNFAGVHADRAMNSAIREFHLPGLIQKSVPLFGATNLPR
jgi:hypothetical protein